MRTKDKGDKEMKPKYTKDPIEKGKRLANEIYNLLAEEGLTVRQATDVLYVVKTMVEAQGQKTLLR